MHQMSVKRNDGFELCGSRRTDKKNKHIFHTIYIYILTCYATEKNDDIYRSG